MIGQNTSTSLDFLNSKVLVGKDSVTVMQLIDKSREALLYSEKVSADYDSLKLEYSRITLENNLLDKVLKGQLKIDTLNNLASTLLEKNYASLEKDYKALSKTKFLQGVVGGGATVGYSLLDKEVSNVSVNLNIGILVKGTYQSVIGLGMGLRSSFVVSVSQNFIF